MISGGILVDKTELLNQHSQGCYGYVDPDYVRQGTWPEKCDVFSFGVVLIGLISKKLPLELNIKTRNEPFLYEWAHKEYQKISTSAKSVSSKFSLVHESLEAEPFFFERDGIALTKLAMLCVDNDPKKRVTMEQAFNSLSELSVVENHADLLSLGNMKNVTSLAISDSQSKLKNLNVSINLIVEVLKSLLKYSINKYDLVLVGKDWQYVLPTRFSYEDIKSCTDGLCKVNFINLYPFGKLYHGNIYGLKVTVKTWEDVLTHISLNQEIIKSD